MARVSRELGTLGYKNNDILPLWFDKIDSMLKEHSRDEYIDGAKVDLEKAMFGAQLSFTPRHYIYQGWASSDEFSQLVETLQDYEESKKRILKKRVGKGSNKFKQVK